MFSLSGRQFLLLRHGLLPATIQERVTHWSERTKFHMAFDTVTSVGHNS